MNGIFEMDQARALASVGQKVCFLALDFRPFWIIRKWGLFHSKDNNLDIFRLSIPIGRYKKSIPILQFILLQAYKHITKKIGKPDIVHAHFYFMTVIAAILKQKYKLPIVATEHSSALNYDFNKIKQRDLQLYKQSFKTADYILSVSPSLQKSINNRFGYNSEVVYNVVNTNIFKFCKRKRSEKFTFLSIGSLQKRKGFDLLITAFYKAGFDSNVFLNIIGEGDEQEYLQQTIDKYNLSEQIKLLGKKSRFEIYENMKKSDTFVLASRGETFGVVYIEAMSTGLPVIATICGGPENFITKEDGILIDADNLESLTDALLHMKNNAYSYDFKKISENCSLNFSEKSIATQLIKNYKIVESMPT